MHWLRLRHCTQGAHELVNLGTVRTSRHTKDLGLIPFLRVHSSATDLSSVCSEVSTNNGGLGGEQTYASSVVAGVTFKIRIVELLRTKSKQ